MAKVGVINFKEEVIGYWDEEENSFEASNEKAFEIMKNYYRNNSLGTYPINMQVSLHKFEGRYRVFRGFGTPNNRTIFVIEEYEIEKSIGPEIPDFLVEFAPYSRKR